VFAILIIILAAMGITLHTLVKHPAPPDGLLAQAGHKVEA
jgi:hypothetical protein